MKPTMSAPASIAASRISGFLMPQILTMRGSAIGPWLPVRQLVHVEKCLIGRCAMRRFEFAVQPLVLAPEAPLVLAVLTLRKPGGDTPKQYANQQDPENDEEHRHADPGCRGICRRCERIEI